MVYALIGATLGSTGAFLLGRYVARRLVARRLAAMPRFVAIERAVSARGRRIVFLLRLSPVVPFNFLNYALGLTTISVWDFVVASLGTDSWRVRLCLCRQGDGGGAGAGGKGRSAEKRVLLRGSGRRAGRDDRRHNASSHGPPGGRSRMYNSAL